MDIWRTLRYDIEEAKKKGDVDWNIIWEKLLNYGDKACIIQQVLHNVENSDKYFEAFKEDRIIPKEKINKVFYRVKWNIMDRTNTPTQRIVNKKEMLELVEELLYGHDNIGYCVVESVDRDIVQKTDSLFNYLISEAQILKNHDNFSYKLQEIECIGGNIHNFLNDLKTKR